MGRRTPWKDVESGAPHLYARWSVDAGGGGMEKERRMTGNEVTAEQTNRVTAYMQYDGWLL